MNKDTLPTISVSLTPELKDLVEGKIRSGQYANTSEVIRAALRTWAQHDQAEDPKLEALIEEGLQSPARRLTPQVIAQIRRQARRR